MLVLNKNKTVNKSFDIEKLTGIFSEFAILKKVKRTGWTWRNVPDCESIADHCYRVNLIAMMLCDALNSSIKDNNEKFDAEKVMRMATLHEIAECRIGDIPYPAQKYIGSEVKTTAETNAVRDMLECFGNGYVKLWEEFENGASREGKLVKAADKLEMMLQALEYEKAGVKTLSDFWENEATFKQIGFMPELKKLTDHLISLRKKLSR